MSFRFERVRSDRSPLRTVPRPFPSDLSYPFSEAILVSRFLFLLLFSAACLSHATAQDSAVSMFDGKSLKGWVGRPDLWSVADGAIVGRTSADEPIKKNTFLIWEGDAPQDFELKLKYWIEAGNSGIQYRSKIVEGAPDFVVGGYQADIEAANNYTGINYEERGRGILAQRGQKVTIGADGEKQAENFGDAAEIAKAFKTDGWNEYRVVAKGTVLQHFINDQLTAEVHDQQPEKASKDGVIALQLHVGPAMVIRFKDLTIRPLKD